jgi:acyl carrier protein
MEAKLRQIIQEEILGSPEPLTPESDLFEAGLDSMAIMQLLLHIEDHFHTPLSPADISRENFRTTSKIVALITSKR